ncbi:exodeoxyribonuclease VII small subunit [Vulcanococcus limneticus]|uniref:exodeoxyribonuclease VII small subunit n=1 Tax=Vulcanococcus limneticus TaxID=2170428 RepID=UPI00398BD229
MADPRLEDTADAEDGLAASSAAGDSRRPASAKPRRTRGAAKAEAAPSQTGRVPGGRAAAAGPPSPRQGAAATEDWLADISRLSYQEARTALELALAKLQSSELEVEDMAGLYRRAQAYAERCETVLQQVEQDVIEWDPQTLAPPAP